MEQAAARRATEGRWAITRNAHFLSREACSPPTRSQQMAHGQGGLDFVEVLKVPLDSGIINTDQQISHGVQGGERGRAVMARGRST